MYSALSEADALTIITEWKEFHYPHYTKMKKLMKNPLIVDGRNVCNPQDLAKNGFKHYSIGRCNITQ
jgi:UDPglucose 6-dehydrogenase